MSSQETNSILKDVKKSLGLIADDEEMAEFDTNIINAINTALNTLTQLGVGPNEGFIITSDVETWDDFIGDDKRLYTVKTYIYIKVKLIFDPPQNSFTISALQEQAKELEWRLNVSVESSNPLTPGA